ncbi:hypothetical protein HPP92_010396 [Vanilla planifolia]|uniref:Uncharacterized protein n=1 Tax=Vanilla planifolia TaxID=51239 RepID=A0A835R9A9_VANPL|nr:hypothetical protein HPP92_010396 [Vanilla planifolia]
MDAFFIELCNELCKEKGKFYFKNGSIGYHIKQRNRCITVERDEMLVMLSKREASISMLCTDVWKVLKVTNSHISARVARPVRKQFDTFISSFHGHVGFLYAILLDQLVR